MKKLLLSGVAVLAVAVAAPANAQVDVDFGGFFKGYGAFVDQDEAGGLAVREFDILRHTEAHVNVETTLDNGLTVGFHAEAEIDGSDAADIEESYVYFSGSWGRVNVGAEDGVAYLLQVAAPSADSNIDGLRSFINPVNINALTGGNIAAGDFDIDYENDLSGESDKLTYLTPVIAGFQAGVSYTPDQDQSGNDFEGVSLDDQADDFGAVLELSARYETEYEGVGVTVGAGFATAEVEGATATNPGGTIATDDRTQYNVGVDLDFAGFGVGIVFTEDDFGDIAGGDDEQTLVVGADYTTGAFKVGGSYFLQENTAGVSNFDLQRYTGGVVYTYGPGMTFRGSISFTDFDADGTVLVADSDSTSILLGTDIKF